MSIEWDVINGLYGSGDIRKINLEKAGYNYDLVQASVNEVLKFKAPIVAEMTAWAKKIASEKYHYVTWTSKDPKTKTCPVCNGRKYDDHFGWNCIGFSFAVWHHGGKLPSKCNCGVVDNGTGEKMLKATDAEALRLAKSHIGLDEITVIKNKNGIPKGQWQAGDICLKFVGDVYKHTFYYAGDGQVIDSSQRSGEKNDIAVRNYKNYTAKIIIRYSPHTVDELAHEVLDGKWGSGDARKKNLEAHRYDYTKVQSRVNELLSVHYPGTLPSLILKKTNAEVIADAIRWAVWIAGDNRFHYGYTNKHGSKNSKDWNPNAHHNGCYFCGTNVTSGGRSKKGILDYEKTYCCNPFVGAAWAHGGCIPQALALCQKGSSWDFGKGAGYDKSSLFDNLGKPDKSKLKAGDVLCSDTHVALYIGNGKVAEAASGDDNKRNSAKWNNSIRISNLTDKKYGTFKRVHRYNGNVNITQNIYHGEISKRVELLQNYIDWYTDGAFFKECGGADGIFGDNTLRCVKDMQRKLNVTVDGIVGNDTISAMKKVVK